MKWAILDTLIRFLFFAFFLIVSFHADSVFDIKYYSFLSGVGFAWFVVRLERFM